jgi:hypothetical protein
VGGGRSGRARWGGGWGGGHGSGAGVEGERRTGGAAERGGLGGASGGAGMMADGPRGGGLGWGLELYDDDLLTAWDSWTLEDMAEAARIA